MLKKTVLASLIFSIPCSIVSGVFVLIPAFHSLIWCFFIGFFVTFAKGASFKNLPNYIASQTAGWVWAIVYFYTVVFFMNYMSGALAMFLGVYIVTVVLCIIHFGFLSKTWFNVVPMLFPPVASFFAVKEDLQLIPTLAASLIIGMIIAMISHALWEKVFKTEADQKVSSVS